MPSYNPRTGVFGGSFNPVHPGHVLVADDVRTQLGLDRVLFIPSPRPPHKPEDAGSESVPTPRSATESSPTPRREIRSAAPGLRRRATERLAPFRDRLAMLRLALRGWPGLEVSDIEAQRPGPSYTIDTLRALAGTPGIGSLYLVLGFDQYQEIAHWHEPTALARLARLVVVSRPGARKPRLFPGHSPFRVRFLSCIGVDISAAAIRSRLASGQSVRYLLSTAVYNYITRHRLYFS
ncbi:MAG: nicotinate-nicotinamide nucleotide adenylyltransferase [candidate division WOR-3 bacterium]